MSSYRVTEFGGMRLRNARNKQSPSAADLAKDVKLWSGSLESWRYPGKVFETGLDKICNLYKFGCSYIADDNPCASFTHGDAGCTRVFSTGVAPWPAYAEVPEGDSCGNMPTLEWRRLGVPSPVNAPTIVSYDEPPAPLDGTHVNYSERPDTENRNYAFSFVNEYGEEGGLSPFSQFLFMRAQDSATIGLNLAPRTDGFNIEYIRIYRGVPTTSEAMAVDEQDGSHNSGFFLVAEIPYRTGTFTFVDDAEIDDLGEMYTQKCSDIPLANLQNITMLDSGSLVASEGKNLWFSEPWNFHIWSCHMNFDFCIEALAYSGDSIYVITNGNPYVVSDSSITDECRCCRTVVQINEPAPIACKKSLVTTPAGVIYATNTGLFRISSGSANYISLGFYSEDQWGQWMPHNLNAVYYKGSYYGFNGKRGFIFDASESFYVDRFTGEESGFTEISLTPDAIFVTKQGEFLMSFDGDIFTWNSSDTYLPYTWRSALNVEGGETNYAYGKIVFEDYIGRRPVPNPVRFKLISDDRVVWERLVSDSTIFTLPRGIKSVNYQFEIEGIQKVMEVHLASTRRELTLISNT